MVGGTHQSWLGGPAAQAPAPEVANAALRRLPGPAQACRRQCCKLAAAVAGCCGCWLLPAAAAGLAGCGRLLMAAAGLRQPRCQGYRWAGSRSLASVVCGWLVGVDWMVAAKAARQGLVGWLIGWLPPPGCWRGHRARDPSTPAGTPSLTRAQTCTMVRGRSGPSRNRRCSQRRYYRTRTSSATPNSDGGKHSLGRRNLRPKTAAIDLELKPGSLMPAVILQVR